MLRWRWWVAAAVLVVVVGVLDVRWIAFPRSDAVARTQLVTVLGPLQEGGRLALAHQIAERYPGRTVLISADDYQRRNCPSGFPTGTTVHCFTADPFTTQGEARYVTAYARAHDMTSVTVLTTTQQVSRARLRFSRCFHGELRVVGASLTIGKLIGGIAYETGATVKAEVWQRGC